MKLQIIVVLLATVGIVTGVAQLGEGQIFITVTSEGKAKVSQSIFPETFVSTIDVHVISENISNLLAIDEENILLGTTQSEDLLKIATLGATTVDLKYNADILSYESGIFKLKYNSDLESRVNLPPLSKLVSLNTIPIEITDEEYVLPPGDISMSFSIRPVTSKEFFVPIDDTKFKIEAITAAKIEEFSANSDEIQFIIKDKAIVLTIIPTTIMANPNDALLNGEKVDFSQFHQNSTHSWIRIDPHEKGLVKILDTTEKTEEGGGCLIATAAYGSEMAPQVQFLREIRDNQLMKTNSGASFMTEFNQFYYSFSPNVADMERENPMLKEMIKIGITPLLSSLYVMEYAETENEILGLGISVILMNIGMYFVLPFVILHQGMRLMRTTVVKKSNWAVISNCNVKSVMKIGLFGLIALFVLSVSVPSAFAQSTESEGQNPIQIILDISYENIQESFVDAGINPEDYPAVFIAAQEEYDEAMAALEEGDLETAEENALLAMALFEDSAEEIAEILDVQQATIQPLGLSTAAANVFNVQERITDTDDETNELRELVKLNNFDDVDFSEYDESVNLAKTLLADGFVPDAQAQLKLANSIKDNLYDEISTIAGEQAAEEIKETLGEQENLGLTNKAINDLEDILEDLTTEETGEGETSVDDVIEDSGDEASGNSDDAPGQDKGEGPGNSENAPGQNKEDGPPGQDKEDGPGNSENAPGQNKDNDDTGLPPGLDSALDTGKENANGQGLGIGKVPPGLAKKLFESGELETGLPPGFETAGDNPSENNNGQGLGVGGIPPGQLKKFDDIYSVYSPDDYFDDPIDDLVEDTFEEKYDKMNKDSKAKVKSELAKQAKLDRIAAAAANGGPPGLAKKANDGITDGESGSTTATIGVAYTVQGFTAIKNGKDFTSNIKIDVTMDPSSALADINNANQGVSFTPDVAGTYTITAEVGGLTDITRTVTAAGDSTYVIDLLDVYQSTSTTLDSGTAVCTDVDLESDSTCGSDLEEGLTYRIELEVDNTGSQAGSPNQFNFLSSVGAGDVLGSISSENILDSGCSTNTDWTESIETDAARASSGTSCSVPAAGTVEFWMTVLLVSDADDGTSTFSITDGTNSDTSSTTTFSVIPGANAVPSVTSSIPDQSVSGNNVPDFTIDLDDVFDDDGGDASLTYDILKNTFSGSFSSISIDGGTGVLTIDYRNGGQGNGSGDITIRATDAGGKAVIDTFNLIDS